jgi:hypothetical protein
MNIPIESLLIPIIYLLLILSLIINKVTNKIKYLIHLKIGQSSLLKEQKKKKNVSYKNDRMKYLLIK